ncbi:cytochrome c oxidase cbb3-type subunit 3 [Rhodobacter aestuarii]|uniref:Cbb3-type cytochrome c oxidase subunit n=1 Tax=Rhodobacter aestuarii TaxID=453582 RepID=A0A1N7PLR6_9RHOB|nr:MULTISPECIES: cytochrome-c oxidase, cbb3-type subunit III [Rhodobacter]PTV94310.1 cytochrome c oxidase cbb3-type subunit 3 [Rhodobacter aestuarii]SIT11575.1 cytochrome c oxidase cbb3-type subunit 3 [Rhodobacter aestuarii]SOC04065.1 cytochrome c oxidase cbb3-type subunit 3 [Rhodobacter sp. JA431]
MSKKPTKKEIQTTGHSWDGIEELNTPLPRWWLWTFYACIVWGVAYSIAMPAWPIFASGATPGLLGSSTRADVDKEIAKFAEMNKAIEEKLVATELTEISSDPELVTYVNNAGGAVFRTWCAQCHGSGAGGNKGFPSLIDSDWLHGGTIDQIYLDVQHGIRDPLDPDTNAAAQMPAHLDDELLEPAQIDEVVQYVRQISGQDADAELATAGAEVFAEWCVSCHGEDAKGMQEMGAPNLTDAIWLYGGDVDTLTTTIRHGRAGVMPSWSYGTTEGTSRLSEVQIRAVSAYVHSLGGGE